MTGRSLIPSFRPQDLFSPSSPFGPGQATPTPLPGSNGVQLPLDQFSSQLGLSSEALAFMGAATLLADPAQMFAALQNLPTTGRNLGELGVGSLRQAVQALVDGGAQLPEGMTPEGIEQLGAEDLISLLQFLLDQQQQQKQAPQQQPQQRSQPKGRTQGRRQPHRAQGSEGTTSRTREPASETGESATNTTRTGSTETGAAATTTPATVEEAPVEFAQTQDFTTRRASFKAAQQMMASAGIEVD